MHQKVYDSISKETLMTFICPPTRTLVSLKCAPLETIQLYLKTFLATRNNNDVNLDGNVVSTLYIHIYMYVVLAR